ncbi:C4-dicarboxylic acid transporter DauA [Maioricimonas rarisocia]|uniref:C4-dicarboxylic acid transporter DauA n=1 Tax=Maioricimonas rarisocia TaxID=2528026 RepID=A0A517Z100_9PLAN|nr:SulP family inorganic anion transporter [Maioricimonas rarisocia]QDU36151.1 C4-dicarboxylic acid transporter DauA [Maioricimonas rarisocia]
MSTQKPNQEQKISLLSNWQTDLPASIVVFLVALPLCMGIAIASGVPVSAGLITGIVAGLVVGWLAGCPLQVSGPAAGLTVIVYDAVVRHGLEMLGLIVLLAGLIQLIAGCLAMGQWFRAVSPAVIRGMLTGIGVLIFSSQFHVMLDDAPKGSGLTNLITIPQAIVDSVKSSESLTSNSWEKRRELSLELGELHRRQVILNEQVTERIPDHHLDELEQEGAPIELELADLAGEQQEIHAGLETLVPQLIETTQPESERRKKVVAAGDAAMAALVQSESALEENEARAVLAAQNEAVETIVSLQESNKNHSLAASIGILTILVLVFWKPLAPGRLKTVPAPLVAVLVATGAAVIGQLPILYVEVPDSMLDELHMLNWMILSDAEWGPILTTALFMAVVASAETLLCAAAVDQMQTGPRTNYDKELRGQGIGNLICGFLGALPMTGVIVRSSANIQSGAKSRLSAILHGLWLLIFVVVLGTLLRSIPTSALAAILVFTGWRLMDKKAFKELSRYGWGEVVIFVATVTIIVVEDLLVGVVVGLLMAIARLAYQFSHLWVRVTELDDSDQIIHLHGAATFLRLPKFAKALESVPPGAKVIVDADHLSFMDHACLELLKNWQKQHETTGGTVEIQWETLHGFVESGKPAPKTPPSQSERDPEPAMAHSV